ncbi:MAG: hypothetical protein ABI743_07530 [bacterium]
MALPNAGTLAQFGTIVMVVIGAAIALFGLGLYKGTLRLFGTIIGGTFGFLFFLSNKADLPDLHGWGGLVWGLLFSMIGGWIGAWLAGVAHYAVFFLLGCVMGYLILLVATGAETVTTLQQWPRALPVGPHGWHWLVMIVVGLIYLAASNWMIAITCAILGASIAATAIHQQEVLWIGVPLGILTQWGLFMRHDYIPPPRRRRRRRDDDDDDDDD